MQVPQYPFAIVDPKEYYRFKDRQIFEAWKAEIKAQREKGKLL